MEFYISQTKADNHAVREAACACIAELGTKVGFLPLNCLTVAKRLNIHLPEKTPFQNLNLFFLLLMIV